MSISLIGTTTAFPLITTAAGFNRRALTFHHELANLATMPPAVADDFRGLLRLSTAFLAIPKVDIPYLIAPARYVGFDDELTPDEFHEQRRGRLIDGDRVEAVLKKIGRLVDQDHAAWGALRKFCGVFGCAPKANARLWLVEIPVETTDDALRVKLAEVIRAAVPFLTAGQQGDLRRALAS